MAGLVLGVFEPVEMRVWMLHLQDHQAGVIYQL